MKILITRAIMRRSKEIKDGTVLEVGKDITADEAEKFISMECAEEYNEAAEEARETADTGGPEAIDKPADEEEAVSDETTPLDKEALLKSISEAPSRDAIDEILSEIEEPKTETETVMEIQEAIKARLAELDAPDEKTLDEKLEGMTLKQLQKDLTVREIPFHTNAKEKNLRKKLKEAIEKEATA